MSSRMFKSFRCLKCDHVFEGLLNVCGRCGGKAAEQSGIAACLDSGRPPGYAGGKNKPYSARSYDKTFDTMFKTMGITNCQHKDGKPHCTFARPVDPTRESYPGSFGKQMPIKSYSSLEAMKRDGISPPPMMMEGKPFVPPNVHPVIEPGAVVGKFPSALRDRTVIEYRDTGS
jgi:hypothetical protein